MDNGEIRALRRLYKEEHERQDFDELVDLWKELIEEGELVCEYIDHFYDGRNAYIITEFYENEDLETYLKKIRSGGSKMTGKHIVKFLVESMESLQALHSKQMVHRDVKMSNFLVDDDKICRLSDFDVLKILREDEISTPTMKGTLAYVAPEVLNGNKFSFPVDIFSVGVIVYEMMMGHKPFPNDLMKVDVQFIPIPTGAPFSSELINLVHRCLSLNPTDRLTAEGVLALPFVVKARTQQREFRGKLKERKLVEQKGKARMRIAELMKEIEILKKDGNEKAG